MDDYETSPTIKCDATGEAPLDDNHSDKTGSEGSSEGFVKVDQDEVLDEPNEQKTPSEDKEPIHSPAVETLPPSEAFPEKTNPMESVMLDHLDPQEELPAMEGNKPSDVSSTDSGKKEENKPELVETSTAEPLVVEEVEKKPLPQDEPSSKPVDKKFDLTSYIISRSTSGVVDLLFWRDVKFSAIVFCLCFLVLLSLRCFSVVSVFAYLTLSLLAVTFTFRLYKFVLQTLNGTQQPNNPFQRLLDTDVTMSPDQVSKYVESVLGHVNCWVTCTRDLVLVKNVVPTLKFALLMWLLTYIGCCFNGLTILTIALVLSFALPPLYEKYQEPIDAYYGIAKTKLEQVTTMIQSKMPGMKPKTQ